jgi:hypothetical protein
MTLQVYKRFPFEVSECLDLSGGGSRGFEEPTFYVVEPRLGVNPDATVPIFEVGFESRLHPLRVLSPIETPLYLRRPSLDFLRVCQAAFDGSRFSCVGPPTPTISGTLRPTLDRRILMDELPTTLTSR